MNVEMCALHIPRAAHFTVANEARIQRRVAFDSAQIDTCLLVGACCSSKKHAAPMCCPGPIVLKENNAEMANECCC